MNSQIERLIDAFMADLGLTAAQLSHACDKSHSLGPELEVQLANNIMQGGREGGRELEEGREGGRGREGRGREEERGGEGVIKFWAPHNFGPPRA